MTYISNLTSLNGKDAKMMILRVQWVNLDDHFFSKHFFLQSPKNWRGSDGWWADPPKFAIHCPSMKWTPFAGKTCHFQRIILGLYACGEIHGECAHNLPLLASIIVMHHWEWQWWLLHFWCIKLHPNTLIILKMYTEYSPYNSSRLLAFSACHIICELRFVWHHLQIHQYIFLLAHQSKTNLVPIMPFPSTNYPTI